MRKHRLGGVGMAALAALSLGVSGCWIGRGGSPSIYFTDQNVESMVEAPLADLAIRTRAVFAELRIRMDAAETDADSSDPEMQILGTSPNEQPVRVELEETSDGLTHVRVSVRESAVQWDREFSRAIIERIVQGF